MVEVLALRAATDPARHARFLSVHRALMRTRESGLVETLAVAEQPRAVVVRRALGEETLAEIRGPLAPEVLAGIAARLIPAILAAGDATGGALSPTDIRLDTAGEPILAPNAVPPTRVGRALTRHAAPETFDGAPPDGAAGLYGLGMVIYQLATGRPAFTRHATGRRDLPPPPSTFHPGTPHWLDAGVLSLLSPQPSERAGSLPTFLEHAQAIGDLREHRATAIDDIAVTRATEGTRRGHLDRAPVASVLLPARALSGLDPGARSLVAGLAALPIGVVDELAAAGLPVVLERMGNRHNARERAEELRSLTDLPVESDAATGWGPGLLAIASGGLSALCLTLGLGLALTGFTVLSIPPLAIGATSAGLGLFAGQRAASRSRQRRLTERSARLGEDAMASRGGPLLRPTWTRLAKLRQQLGLADLPETAATDLRSALKAIESRVTAMASVIATAEEALRGVDLAQSRSRLATLSADRPERDRLARTVADLEEVDRRRQRVLEEQQRVDAALDEFASVLGQLASGDAEVEDSSEILAELIQTAHLARAAREETA